MIEFKTEKMELNKRIVEEEERQKIRKKLLECMEQNQGMSKYVSYLMGATRNQGVLIGLLISLLVGELIVVGIVIGMCF